MQQQETIRSKSEWSPIIQPERERNLKPHLREVIFSCRKSDRLARVSVHVINRGMDKNHIVMRKNNKDGSYETIYDCALHRSKGFTVIGIKLKSDETVTLVGTQELGYKVNALIKEKKE